MAKSKRSAKSELEKDLNKTTKFSKFSLFFFKNVKLTTAIMLLLVITGTASYTTWHKREGFPPIQFPLSFVGGAYPGQSVETVDSEIIAPLSEALGNESVVETVDASSASDGSFTMGVFFDDSVNSAQGTLLVESIIAEQVDVPEGAFIQAVAIDPGSFLFEYDMVVHVYSAYASPGQLDTTAGYVVEQLTSLGNVDGATAINSISQLPNGMEVESSFTRIGLPDSNDNVNYYSATAIGVKSIAETDVLELSDEVSAFIAELDLSDHEGDVTAIISADFARDITSQIDFLESNLLTSLLAVALISLILITWRASIITGLFMISVMLVTILILYLVGYTLNVITLFALILSLGLFVDDATIVVEAIDVKKHEKKLTPTDVVREAVNKVGAASLAGTLTTMLVFAILVSPTGILGEFIRLIPITVMIALAVSFVLSITLIPFLAKFIMLRNRETSWLTRVNPVLKFEAWLGKSAGRLILNTKNTSGKIYGAFAIVTSLALLIFGAYVFGFKVDNNTFPPAKDTDQIGIQVQFADLKAVSEAKEISNSIDSIVSDTIGDNVVYSYYGIERLADAQQATIIVDLVPFTDRDVKAPVLAEMLSSAFAENFDGPAQINVGSIDNGPPSSQFPFGIRVFSEDTDTLRRATDDFVAELVGQELENFNGDTIQVLSSRIDGVDGSIFRDNGARYAIARFTYDSKNPTIVSLLTEAEFTEIYDDAKLSGLGITMDIVDFDAGQEGDFQDSFDTLLLAIPIALVLMFILLAVQFRSILQPFLILLAVPFTLFGVAVGLYLTNNAASFFALVGFVGLTGIAVNNTIMLTDYANQEKRAGLGTIDAISEATKKRLRPLIATTLTTIVALLPLALTDPFWEPLAVTIMFGLLSSTILVILSFPFYYIATDAVAVRTKKVLRKIVRRV